jgi:hypothetical protein
MRIPIALKVPMPFPNLKAVRSFADDIGFTFIRPLLLPMVRKFRTCNGCVAMKFLLLDDLLPLHK